ncbi:MAG: SH3 domain-containing protein [Chloroflexi bacterium]|nr:SH3 domain-containing protein [Chloroflexota bacterium]
MTDSGLSTRLRQQSRRAGLMVGITMVLAIAICIFGAAGLFAWLSRPFSDLIPMVAPAAQIQPTPAPEDPAGGQPESEQPAPTAPVGEVQTVATQAVPAEPTAAPNANDFEPTHQIGAGQSVNFRSGPSTADPVIVALPPATELEYLDEDEPTTNPSDGERWMRFRTENGDEGWIREIDTEPYQP